MAPIKITVVGDGIVGKTCMLVVYTQKKFPEEYVPTVFEQYGTKISVDGREEEVTLWDTAGQEDYERLRPLTYPNTNCFLICFSVDKAQASYDNVHLKWVPEVRHHTPHASFVLVATKIDLREDPTKLCYSTEDGKKLRKKVKAHGYVECSALHIKGLDEVMQEAVRVCRNVTHKPKKNNCTLL